MESASKFMVTNNNKKYIFFSLRHSVPDPDPPDPRVFWPPRSGSFYHHAKIKKS